MIVKVPDIEGSELSVFEITAFVRGFRGNCKFVCSDEVAFKYAT